MNTYGEKYFRSRNYADYWQREERYHQMAQELHRFLMSVGYRNHELILDFGCAFGYVVGGLIEAGCNAVGYEISEFAIQQAITRRIPISKAICKCTVLVALDVFEHMSDDAILRAIGSSDPDILVLRIPVSMDGKKFALEISRRDPTHSNRKTKPDWVKFMRNLNYVVRPLRLFTIYDTPGVACFAGFKV